MEEINIKGEAHDPEVVTAPNQENGNQDYEEQQRVHAYLVHCGDAEAALERAHNKVSTIEERLEEAKASVEKAEARLAALLGRD